MGSSKAQTIGYKYYLGIQFGLCHAIDALVGIFVDQKVLWQGSQAGSGRINLNAPMLLGGDQFEGGVVGDLDVCAGEATQTANDYLTNSITGTQPGYRNRVTAVFRGGQTGSNSRTPRPWAFRLQRALSGWDGDVWNSAACVIPLSSGSIKAMNAAHIIYEAITNRLWGMGLDRGLIDNTSFTAAATQFQSEGMGLCLTYDQQSSIGQFIQTVCDHAACVVVLDPASGLFKINLIRDNYDVSSLIALDDDDLLEVISYELGTPVGSTNELAVTWHDPTSNQDRTITLQSLGNIQAQGGVVPDSKSYPGIPTHDLAARVCQRDLRAVSVPLSRLEAKFKRTAWTLVPGTRFVLTSQAYGIQGVVFTVGDYDGGTLADGSITLTCVEDVFSLPDAVYAQEQPSGFQPITEEATPSTERLAFEVPYRDLVQVIGSASAQGLPTDAGYVALCAERPTSSAGWYELWTQAPGGKYTHVASGDWAPTGSLLQAIGPADTSITVAAGFDLDLASVGEAAMIEGEIVRIDALDASTGVMTIARGCCDTVPAAHAAGVQFWGYDNGSVADQTQYTTGETMDLRALTVTSWGMLDLTEAPTDQVVVSGRAARPYPPGNLQIQGVAYPATVIGPLILTWSHRDRVLQDDQLIDTTHTDIGPEDGTTYTVSVSIGSSTVFQQAGITGNSFTPPMTQNGACTVRIWAVRNGLQSQQALTASFTYTTPNYLAAGTGYLVNTSGQFLLTE